MNVASSSPSSEAIKILTEILTARQKKNAFYTKTAFARDMGISQPQLSLVLSGRRPLTTAQAKKSSILLRLNESQERKLVEATMDRASGQVRERLEELEKIRQSKSFTALEYDRHASIAKWFHLPLLVLVTTKDFKNSPVWISKKLGITTDEAREALDRLLRLGLLVKEGKTLKMADRLSEVTPKKSESIVREHHVQMMKRAEEALQSQTDEAAWMMREISSLSVGCDPSKIPEAKTLIKKFKEDLTQLITQGEIRSVYQFNVQLFPITKD